MTTKLLYRERDQAFSVDGGQTWFRTPLTDEQAMQLGRTLEKEFQENPESVTGKTMPENAFPEMN